MQEFNFEANMMSILLSFLIRKKPVVGLMQC